jgi:Skp family chaperone for outer membrane proteins
MKKNIIFFIFFFFISNNNTLADNSISFIDVDYIYSNSIIGKKINDKLNTESTKIKEELSNYQKEIQDEKDKLINQKKIISDEEFKKKTIDLEKKIQKYNMIISKKNKAFTKFKNETKGLFLKKLMNIVEEYVEANSIQLILKKENIIIGINNLDISNDILKLLNEKINDINLK